MKCSICNAENPSDATSCQECGFSLSLGQPEWPDFPSVDIPEPLALPEWPETPEAEAEPPALSSIPPWPEPADQVPTPAVAEEIDVETQPFPLPASNMVIEDPLINKVDYPDILTKEPAKEDTPSPDYPSDDELARTHIARGFEATREGLNEQARWEFEQARDLADSEDIIRMARAQLGELLPREAAPVMQEPVRPIVKPPPQPAPSIASRMDWKTTLRIGVVMGVISAVCASCTAVPCVGFLFSPILSFVAGLLIARNKASPSRQPRDTIYALVAGGITGLGGWIGQAISLPTWTASVPNTLDGQDIVTDLICIAMFGVFYIPISIALSALGWRLGKRREPSD